MEIPEISEQQYNSLKIICIAGAYSQIVPDEERDDPKTFEGYTRGTEDTAQLVKLGFVEEITAQCSDVLDRVFLADGRRFRVYALTPLGRVMFNEADKRIVQ